VGGGCCGKKERFCFSGGGERRVVEQPPKGPARRDKEASLGGLKCRGKTERGRAGVLTDRPPTPEYIKKVKKLVDYFLVGQGRRHHTPLTSGTPLGERRVCLRREPLQGKIQLRKLQPWVTWGRGGELFYRCEVKKRGRLREKKHLSGPNPCGRKATLPDVVRQVLFSPPGRSKQR